MRNICLLVFFFCCGIYAQDSFVYKDSSQPVHVRVQDLLSRMTLEEKINQLRHVHAYSIMEDGKINKDKLEELLQGKSKGFIEAITLPGEECQVLMNEVQHYMLTKT